MAVRTKRYGQNPNATERWMELAKDEETHINAVYAYRELFKNATLVEACRKVRTYHFAFKSRQEPRE